MRHVQRFALDNIYCAPGQDRQYSFQMVRVNKPHLLAKGFASVYGVPKHLPTTTGRYHVFVIGNLPTTIVNLLSQKQAWLRDSWIRASTDMVLRNYILQVYDTNGVMFPREHIHYSFVDESSLVVALEVTDAVRNRFSHKDFTYLHLYSNAYFQSVEFKGLARKTGIDYRFKQVNDNLDKVQLQTFISTHKAHGGDAFVYVDGYYVPEVTLSIENGSLVEVVYDQSVYGRESVAVEAMRTFGSTLDSRVKRMMHRQKTKDFIEYQDDCEVYVHSDQPLVKRGLYFYKHKAHSMRNITDKDYSFDSQFLNNTCARLNEVVNPGVQDKKVVVYTRYSGRGMPLVYSALKLHELYSLPQDVQRDVLNNTGYTLDLFRVEALEASAYFQVASAQSMSHITSELATEALGYAAITKYFADTPSLAPEQNVVVPELYQWDSTAFEYDQQGLFIDHYPTNGPLYTKTNPTAKFVEFMKGSCPSSLGPIFAQTAQTTLSDIDEEIVVLSAYFDGPVRQSAWEEVPGAMVTRVGKTVSWQVEPGKKVKLVRLNHLNLYTTEMALDAGVLYFPLTVLEDRGSGPLRYVADTPPQNLGLYLNDHCLTQGIDYEIDFPHVNIFSKKYINYALALQKIHVRTSGFTHDKLLINHLCISGFVSHGVLTRNKAYDLRDDRVFSVFIDGKLYDRSKVYFSETDSTVRTSNPLNGLPYSVKEHFIPIGFATGGQTRPLYNQMVVNNKRISALFDLAHPEPSIENFNVIFARHHLFSPVVSKVINDILSGSIAASTYTNPYGDEVIHALLEQRYKGLLKLDPIKKDYPSTIVEIHPHLGNTVIGLDLFQYRFVQNVIRVVTNNKPERINLSGYLLLSS